MKSVVHFIAALSVATSVLAADESSITIITTHPGPPFTSSPPQTGCPTVTATRELCTTCPIPACLGLATVTQSCGCPEAIATVFLDFPCADKCAGVGCSTSYDIVTESGCSTPTYPPTSPPPYSTTTTTTSSSSGPPTDNGSPTYPPQSPPSSPPTYPPTSPTGTGSPPIPTTSPPPVPAGAARLAPFGFMNLVPFGMLRFW